MRKTPRTAPRRACRRRPTTRTSRATPRPDHHRPTLPHLHRPRPGPRPERPIHSQGAADLEVAEVDLVLHRADGVTVTALAHGDDQRPPRLAADDPVHDKMMVSLKRHNCGPGLRTECATYRIKAPRARKRYRRDRTVACGQMPLGPCRSTGQRCNPTYRQGGYLAAPELGSAIPKDRLARRLRRHPSRAVAGPVADTVRQSVTEMAEQATIMVLRLAAGDTLQTERLDLATDLVIRASTAPPRPVRSGRR